ncbi:PhnB protein [Seinonella peptonophila]|uniref:PhnB protein n=1 Tax=Seinonella peptonophila TaxID=112248 RepID=A0A1M5A8C7_9BACL|nr:VOC family protein [Seinonella peptonophila]SHF26581.1 PhnB protein [Seinonella peptonophila]
MILGIHPYIVTQGRGKEAVEFYQHAVQAQVLQVQTFGEMPDNPAYTVPEEAKDFIVNAHLKIGESDFMISDSFPGQPLAIGEQVTIALTTNDVEQTKQIFASLQEEGQVLQLLEATFWSPAYGQVKDKFGITWQITTFIESQSLT